MNELLKQKFPPELSGIYNEAFANQLAETQGAIGSLNQMEKLLHNPQLLMRPILGKEAESSSQLEGTQASIVDAYKVDIEDQSPEKFNNTLQILNYEQAMLTGKDMVEKNRLNIMVIREVHKRLVTGVRGQDKKPGEFRKDKVWIGEYGTTPEEARYVAPDAEHVPALMEDLEKFIQNRGTINPLLACGVIHHRFEAIHPFEDGNGRTGRLLISLYLMSQGMLKYPILYPSGYFEKNKQIYLNALSKVDRDQDWSQWLMLFLKAIEHQAKLSVQVGLSIDDLFKESRKKIQHERANLNLVQALEFSFVRPFLTAPILSKMNNIPLTSCQRYLDVLAKKGIISDFGLIKKQRVFINEKLLAILNNI